MKKCMFASWEITEAGHTCFCVFNCSCNFKKYDKATADKQRCFHFWHRTYSPPKGHSERCQSIQTLCGSVYIKENLHDNKKQKTDAHSCWLVWNKVLMSNARTQKSRMLSRFSTSVSSVKRINSRKWPCLLLQQARFYFCHASFQIHNTSRDGNRAEGCNQSHGAASSGTEMLVVVIRQNI